jgi:hypothetical protein
MRTTVTTLPRAARLACWLPALVDGRASLDDTITAVLAADARHDVTGLAERLPDLLLDEPQPMALALGRLRSLSPAQVQLVLPVPGDLTGVAGPPELNVDALEAGEAVVLGDAGIGLVPHAVGPAVVWNAHPAVEPPPYDLAAASRSLRRAVAEAADSLATLDVARWNPAVAEAFLNLRAPLSLDLPDGGSTESAAVLGNALRSRMIVDLALDDDGGATSASEIQARRAALQPLDRASRLAISAACSTDSRR